MWGPLLAKQTVLLQCDNLTLVTAINKGSAKATIVMHLLWCLWFFNACNDVALTASHIPGAAQKTLADFLSRNKMEELFKTSPKLSKSSTPLPTALLEIILPETPNWTSPRFRELFKATKTQISLLEADTPQTVIAKTAST